MRTLLTAAVATLIAGVSLAPALAATTVMSKTTQKATTSSSTKAPAKPRTAASLDCSKQADAKNLHGKDRKTFRETCMKGAK